MVGGRSLDAVLSDIRAGERLAPGDRALVQELAYGTVRHLGTLRNALRALAPRPPERRVESLLWVALYQLEHSRAPAHAVVDQAVAACSAPGGTAKAAGFVNAVLRRFLRERDDVLAQARSTPEGRWSHPAWWIERVRSDHPHSWESILAAGNSRPPLTLRVNRLRTSRDRYLARLAEAAIPARPVLEDGLIVEHAMPAPELPGYGEGLFSVQDAGAQWAAPLLDVRGRRVLDACAAPGGKTTQLAEHGASSIVAIDPDAARLARVHENLQRLGLAADVRVADARDATAWWSGPPFERILCDVPCTASGVVRRHPDIKWLRREQDLASFARRQAEILDGSWRVLASGGKLLYVTCSVFDVENDRQVEAFLARHPDAVRESLALAESPGLERGQLLPGDWGPAQNHDGFFYALLRKR